MTICRISVFMTIGLLALASFGCSNSQPPTDPASFSDSFHEMDRMVRPEPVSGNQSEFLGTWGQGSKTLTIKRMGQERFRLHTEASCGAWSGLGHQRGNELIVIFWMEWNVSPQQADRHWFATYSIDANDILHFAAYKPDGAAGATGTLVRVE